jgi:hypothetical protein
MAQQSIYTESLGNLIINMAGKFKDSYVFRGDLIIFG